MAKIVRAGFVVVLGAMWSLFIAEPAEGQLDPCSGKGAGFTGTCTAEATTYGFTMKRFRLKRTTPTGAGFFTVGEGDQLFDAGSDAGVSAGQKMGEYISGKALETPESLSVTELEYTAVSPVLSTIWSVKGSTTVPSSCFTKSASPFFGTTGPAQTRSITITSLDGDPPGVTLDTVAKTLTIEDSSITGLPLKIQRGEAPTTEATVNFDPGSGVLFTFAAGVCTGADFGPLGVTMSITKQ